MARKMMDPETEGCVILGGVVVMLAIIGIVLLFTAEEITCCGVIGYFVTSFIVFCIFAVATVVGRMG